MRRENYYNLTSNSHLDHSAQFQFQFKSRSRYSFSFTFVSFVLSWPYHMFYALNVRRGKYTATKIDSFIFIIIQRLCLLFSLISLFQLYSARYHIFFSHVFFLFSILWTFHFSFVHAIFPLVC